MKTEDRLIVALDEPSTRRARNLVKKLGDTVSFYKVGWELYLSGGMRFIKELRQRGKRIFLDLKMDDIPETVKRATGVLPNDIEFFTLQGDYATYEAAREGCVEGGPKFLYVPVLSSRYEEAYTLDAKAELEKMVQNGLDGVIASGKMIGLIRSYFNYYPNLTIVAPGIRREGESYHDHRRSMTPRQALAAGATYLVIGRPIRDAKDPLRAAEGVLEEMETP